MNLPPSAAVRRAFGAGGDPVPLEGGQGRSWRVGDIVLKPVDNPVEHDFVSTVLASWDRSHVVAVPAPVRSALHTWVYDGWAAARFLPGRAATMRDDAALIRQASEVFHAAIEPIEPPDFLARRGDRWAFGDRVAWEGAAPVGGEPTRAQIHRLRDAFEPVTAPAQLVHGDLGGHVLLTDAGTPAVIDWAPYARPAAFALAVASGDAVRWEGVPVAFLDDWADVPQWYQLLARALVYRLATAGAGQLDGSSRVGSEEHAVISEPAVSWVLSRLPA